MGTSFRHPYRKIALAREQIEILRLASSEFLKEPLTQVVEFNPGSNSNLHKLKRGKPVPDRVFNSADSVIGALRSALDKACYATASCPNAKSAHFPIADDLSQLESVVIARNCRDLDPAIVGLIKGFKPWNGGNEFIWSINRLANTDKHKCLEPYIVNLNNVSAEFTTIIGGPFSLGFDWSPSLQELTFMKADPSVSYEGCRIKCRSYMSIGGISSLTGVDAIEYLTEAASEFETIISLIEQEAVKLGLIAID